MTQVLTDAAAILGTLAKLAWEAALLMAALWALHFAIRILISSFKS